MMQHEQSFLFGFEVVMFVALKYYFVKTSCQLEFDFGLVVRVGVACMVNRAAIL